LTFFKGEERERENKLGKGSKKKGRKILIRIVNFTKSFLLLQTTSFNKIFLGGIWERKPLNFFFGSYDWVNEKCFGDLGQSDSSP